MLRYTAHGSLIKFALVSCLLLRLLMQVVLASIEAAGGQMLVRVLWLLLELGAWREHRGLAQRAFSHWVLFELIQVQLNTLGCGGSGHVCAELLIRLL